jgi:hypothetical protein
VREVRLTAVGHPDVTGRHEKTLELTAEDAITARATCILGVAAGPLPGELPTLRGRVRLSLATGGASAVVDGEVNPGYRSAERLIVRRSGRLDPDTFLVNASAAAADLPADLLTALATAGAAIEVTASEVGDPAPVVLVLTGGPATDEIARLAAQADLVVDLTGRGEPPPAVPLTAPRRHGLPDDVAGHRTVVVLTGDPARAVPVTRGARVVLWPPVPGADLLLSAGRAPLPLLTAGAFPTGAGERRELARLLRETRVPVVLDLPAGADLAVIAPDHAVLTPDPEVGWGVRASAAGPSRARGADARRAGGADAGRAGGADAGRSAVGPSRAGGADAGRSAADAGRGGGAGAGAGAVRLVVLPPPRDLLAVDPAELARLLRRTSSGRDTAAVLTALGLPRNDAYRLASDIDTSPDGHPR